MYDEFLGNARLAINFSYTVIITKKEKPGLLFLYEIIP